MKNSGGLYLATSIYSLVDRRLSLIGRKGARRFWERFSAESEFRDSMIKAWKSQRYDPAQKIRAAKRGAKGLWDRYHRDPEFRKELDEKLRESRSRGGTKSLRNLGEAAFKQRLGRASPNVRARYTDSLGNRLRSSLELTIANVLADAKIHYLTEPRIEVGIHAYYPDFIVRGRQPRIIEVAGYAGDRYWDRTAEKIRRLVESDPKLRVAVVTTYLRIMKRRMTGTPRVTIFSPYEGEKLIQWCRGKAGVQ